MPINAQKMLEEIEDWYVTVDHTYIQIYDVAKSPHALPKFVTYHMVCLEIIYQTYVHGIGVVLTRKK